MIKQGQPRNRSRVLYISYTGILEPLGQSQVLQYVLGLAGEHDMTLLTFEKPDALRHTRLVAEVADSCRDAGVDWQRLPYHNRPNLPASLYDVLAGTLAGIRLARAKRAHIVHCRSYLAGIMGLLVKRATGVKHVFDMRGFWPDERVDGGIWRRNSLRYRVFKRLERHLFLGTDHVVSLTRAGVREIGTFGYLQGRLPPMSVIPTCTNLDLFRGDAGTPGENKTVFTLGYVGSTGSWYLFDAVASVVKLLFDLYPDSRFLVINKGAHDAIRQQLLREGVDMSRVELRAVDFEHVPGQIERMDAGVFFIKPAWSKRASCPTRMGEFLAMGKPCLANGGVGDVEEDFRDTATGVTVSELDQSTLLPALRELLALCREPGIAQRCRTAAEERFSLARGVERYSAIYTSLIHDNEPGTA